MGYGAPKGRPGPKPSGRILPTAADRMAATLTRRAMVDRRTCADPKRRARLERDPARWLKHYLAATYTRPFERPHLEIIEGVMRAHKSGGRFVVAAERGIGKSAILWGMVLYLKLSGQTAYPVCIPWADKALHRAFRFWKMAVCFNDAIGEDYPEFVDPFRHARGVPQRVSTTVWADTMEPTGAQLTVGEGMIILPDRLGAIGGSTINGNVRGLNHPQEDGTILRPSIVMLDDVQDRKTATSAVQVSDTVDIIDGDVAGMGGVGADLPMLMSGNCITPDDVMAHYLAHREWHALLVPCVEAWPDGWQDEASEPRRLWAQWYELFAAGGKDRVFYRANKQTMTRGMRLSAPRSFARSEKTPDPLFGAMRMYHRMGHNAFMAERQQAPVRQSASVYQLDEATILSRLSGYPRLHAPAGSVLTCGVDINYVGLNWAVVAGDGLSGARRVVAHGIWPPTGGLVPKGVTDEQACAIIRRGIGQFSAQVLAPMRVTCGTEQRGILDAGFDASAGKWQAAVVAACRETRIPVRLWALKAFGTRTYRPQRADIRQGQGWRVTEWPGLGRVFVVNADLWREAMQRGFLVEPSEAGALSLYHPDETGENRTLAQQVAGEKLEEHVTTEKNEYYTWRRTPGLPNDRSDALVYALALTGLAGIGEHRAPRPQARHRPTGITSIPL